MTSVLALVLALGAGLGVLSSLTNQAVSPVGVVASLLANAGWAWAGMAVAAGWLVGTRARGAVAGALALLATTTAYYGMDAVLRREAFASYWYEMRVWWLAALTFGSVLGVVGGSIRRPGVPGLIAGLIVPIGAAVEMAWLPRWSGSEPGLDWARSIVWVAAGLSAGLLVTRFLITERRRRPA